MIRDSKTVLVGGGRVFVNNHDVGWLAQGDIQLEQQGSQVIIKESEGGTAKILSTDKEAHFTFPLLNADLDILRMFNPSYTRVAYQEDVISVVDEFIEDMGRSNSLAHFNIDESQAVTVVPAAQLVSPVEVDDTILYVDNIRRFAVNDTITITRNGVTESGTVSAVDPSQGTIELSTALVKGFASGSVVKITSAAKALNADTDYRFYPLMGYITRNTTSADLLEGDGAAISYSYKQGKSSGFAAGSFEDSTPYRLSFYMKISDTEYRNVNFWKARLSGNISPFKTKQDGESPIDIDVVALNDETRDTRHNLFEIIDCTADDVPGGGW